MIVQDIDINSETSDLDDNLKMGSYKINNADNPNNLINFLISPNHSNQLLMDPANYNFNNDYNQ